MATFDFSYDTLLGLYAFTPLFDQAIETVNTPSAWVQVHYQSGDAFGLYSSGRRVFMHVCDHGVNLYLWCGLLYSDQKRAGLIVEIDRFSNQSVFERAHGRMMPSPAYDIEESDAFIKLFMTDSDWAKLQSASPEVQVEQLREFFTACVEAFAKPYAQ